MRGINFVAAYSPSICTYIISIMLRNANLKHILITVNRLIGKKIGLYVAPL